MDKWTAGPRFQWAVKPRIIIIIIIIIIDRYIGVEVSVSNDHEVAGSIPGNSTILNVD